jgi:dTDP-4-amino-4,6-dideoxygalactose transaminase
MWMFGVRFEGLTNYDHANKFFTDAGIETRPMFYPYTVHPHLNFVGSDRVATKLNQSVVIFPSFPELSDDQIDLICDRIAEFSNLLKNII